jgi:hypothetical protein
LACPAERKNEAADPLLDPCEYFRWSDNIGSEFWGYTHRDSPLGIMINVCRQDGGLLETLAEECFHIYQDVKHGPGWRAATDDEVVEREAKEFVQSKTGEIRAFLEGWRPSC